MKITIYDWSTSRSVRTCARDVEMRTFLDTIEPIGEADAPEARICGQSRGQLGVPRLEAFETHNGLLLEEV